jgi:hypothetical protein
MVLPADVGSGHGRRSLRNGLSLKYHEFLYVVLLFYTLIGLAGHAYGYHSIAGSILVGLSCLLLVAIKNENTGI